MLRCKNKSVMQHSTPALSKIETLIENLIHMYIWKTLILQELWKTYDIPELTY